MSNHRIISGTLSSSSSLSGTINPKVRLKGTVSPSVDMSGNIMTTVLKGLSAYEVAKVNGYKGTVEEWLDSLIGNGIASTVMNSDYTLTINFTDGTSFTTLPLRGSDGDNGHSPYIGENGNWFVWDENEKTYKDTGINVNASNDYELQINKPQIESVELIGNKSFSELGLSPIDADDLIEILV